MPTPSREDGLSPIEPEGVVAKIAERWPRLHFPAAVLARYSALRGSQMAALVAFSGFLSLFPLLIALNSILDMVLSGRPDLRQRLVDKSLGSIPVIGSELEVGRTRGSGVMLAVGLLGALWAGLAAMNALQTAYDDMWQVSERPNFAVKRLRSLSGLCIVGCSLIAATGLSAFAAGSSLPGGRWWGILAGLVLNIVGVAGAQVALGSAITWSDVRTGAVFAGVALSALQMVGGLLVAHYLVGASATYGTFAAVIALTSWFGLNAQVALIGVCINAEQAARRPNTGSSS